MFTALRLAPAQVTEPTIKVMTFTVNVCKEVIDDDVPPSKLSRYINERHTLEILGFGIRVVVRDMCYLYKKQKLDVYYQARQSSRLFIPGPFRCFW